jgi:hypothetical protein
MELFSSRSKAGLIERFLYGPDPLYREGRIGYWDMQPLANSYILQSVRGFRLLCHVQATVRRVDDAAFNAARMLDAGKLDDVVRAWEEDILGPTLAATIFTFEFVNFHIPGHAHATKSIFRFVDPELSHYAKRHQRAGLTRDGGFYTIEAIHQLQQSKNWLKNGCVVEPLWIRISLTSSMIRENHAMLTPEELEAAEKDPRVFVSVEVAAVNALERWRRINDEFDRAFCEQSVKNDYLEINTKQLDNRVAIQWTTLAAARESEVLGFREENGFSDDPYNEVSSKDRLRVEHNKLSTGTPTDVLAPGKTHYYTFFVKDAQSGRKDGFLRFIVRAPTVFEQQKELEHLANQIEWLKSRQEQNERARDEGAGQSIVRELAKHAEMETILVDFYKSYSDALRQKGYTDKEIDDQMATLKALAKQLRSGSK